MSIRHSALALIPYLLLALIAPAGGHAQGVEGSDYRKLVAPQPTASPGKIEVIEFFSYGCPHCAHFAPLIDAWSAKLPADVVFRRVPVGFNRDAWINLQRAYYALQATGDLARLDGALFHAIHDEHKQLFEGQNLADWVGRNGGDAEKFSAAYVSFGVNNQTVQADRMAQNFAIDSVPSLEVNGQYVALANPERGETGYLNQLLANTDALIARVRAESAPQPAAKHRAK